MIFRLKYLDISDVYKGGFTRCSARYTSGPGQAPWVNGSINKSDVIISYVIISYNIIIYVKNKNDTNHAREKRLEYDPVWDRYIIFVRFFFIVIAF